MYASELVGYGLRHVAHGAVPTAGSTVIEVVAYPGRSSTAADVTTATVHGRTIVGFLLCGRDKNALLITLQGYYQYR